MKTLFFGICFFFSIVFSFAQETGFYNIISISGKVKDMNTDKEMEIGSRIELQTLVEFGSLYDKAVLLSPSKVKYFLEPPATSFIDRQLTVSSAQALKKVKSRPQLVTGIRGYAALKTEGVTQKTLRDYFGTDTFTVIGSTLQLPVSQKDIEKYDLIIRYEKGDVEEYILPDFEISKKMLNLTGSIIRECYILMKEENKMVPVTQIMLSFVEQDRLFKEFDTLLSALNIDKKSPDAHQELHHYCNDVYGIIDRKVLEQTIDQFFKE